MKVDFLQPNITLKDYADFGESGVRLKAKLARAFLGLPSEKVTPATLPADGPYQVKSDGQGGLKKIESGHFDTIAVQVEKHLEPNEDPFIWLQTLIHQKGKVMQTSKGEMEIAGFILNFLTPDNNVLMIADNEPGAPIASNTGVEETHPVLRPLVQTGMPKFADILQGNEIKDPVLKKVVDSGVLTPERMHSPWTLSLHDSTRMEGVNIVKTERLTHEEVEKLSEVLPLLEFTMEEVQILLEVGKYLPPHTFNNALNAALFQEARSSQS